MAFAFFYLFFALIDWLFSSIRYRRFGKDENIGKLLLFLFGFLIGPTERDRTDYDKFLGFVRIVRRGNRLWVACLFARAFSGLDFVVTWGLEKETDQRLGLVRYKVAGFLGAL